MKIVKILWSSALLLALSACATGPLLKDSTQALPPLESGKGRVFFYRTNIIAATYTPDVLLNGEKVGKPVQRGMFFKDVSPGSYAVTTKVTSEIVNFHVGAGEKKYIKLSYSFGFGRIYLELVDSATGEAEVSNLSLMGQGQK
jgi:hypothetical protein